MSYNSEGLMSKEQIKEILRERGKVEVMEAKYWSYKSFWESRQRPDSIIEYLFLVRC
jgi:adenine-specific DNA methylase